MLLIISQKFPETVLALLPLIPQYGYYKDFLLLLEKIGSKDRATTMHTRLVDQILDIIVEQIRKDQKAVEQAAEGKKTQISLLVKYLPREKRHFAKGDNKVIFKSLVEKLFPGQEKMEARAKYRRLIHDLSKEVQITEKYMCANLWDEISFTKVPSLCLNRFRKAFLNENVRGELSVEEEGTGNRYPDDPKRVECRRHLRESIEKGKIQGKVLQPHEIVNLYFDKKTSTLEDYMLGAQWEKIKGEVVKSFEALTPGALNLGKVVPLCDVSGSMAGTPMLVAIGLSILISELTHEAYRNRMLTFSSDPTWVDLSGCKDLKEKVNLTRHAEWGMSTNFEKAITLILEVAEKSKLVPDEIPALIVFSDMQFDEAVGPSANRYMYGCSHSSDSGSESIDGSPSRNKWETHHENLSRRFEEVGRRVNGVPYVLPQIIYWNLRGDTRGFAAQSDTPGVQMLSGYSPAMFKLILSGEPLEEEEVLVNEDGTTSNIIKRVTPYDTFRKAVDDELYDPIRLVLHQSTEGILKNYEYVKESKE